MATARWVKAKPNRSMLMLLGSAALLALCVPASAQQAGGKFLDAKFCGDTLNLNPGSDYDAGSCQLWKLVADADGWSRLQLKRNGKYLDAKYCSDELNMNPGSNFDHGSCQLWKFVPDADGWSRVQLKRNGKFLDALNCTDDVHLSELSNAEGGACQLWRLIPVEGSGGWSRLQIKFVGGGAPSAAVGNDEYTLDGDTYGWFDDGWDGPGWYIVGYEFRRGFGFGGREGWHGWHHHGSHAHGGAHHENHAGGDHHGGEHHGGGGGHQRFVHHNGGGGHHGGGGHGGGHHGGGGGGHHGGGGGGHHGGGGHGGGGHGGGGHGGGGHGGGGHGGGHHSDIRLKHGIVLLGRLANGIGFYRFSYNGSNKMYVGVMAQEVEAVMPQAVARGRDGYLRVYYDQLGLRLQSWSEWVAAGRNIPTGIRP
jgi:hypothetical protein